MYLSGFTALNPPHSVPQIDGLRWLGQAHSLNSQNVDCERFAKLLQRYGCGPDKIEKRGTFLRDFTHLNWQEMQIFSQAGELASIDQRMAFFNETLLPAAERLYPETSPDFTQWIHVTCTGYLSPSLIQKIVSTRDWGEKVECLHAYHMGCYAALPALRMARGLGEVDILHTELCTLHLNPADHEPEQLVIQSLFADGVIRYRAGNQVPVVGFRVLETREWIAPQSLSRMTWAVAKDHFKMTLGKDVPKLVQEGISALVKPWHTPKCQFAIHPGGPRIIDAVKEALGLSEEQVSFSRQILRQHGNMSSATLPHIWQKMLEETPAQTPVISMAFGPGLTLSASLMETVRQ